MASQISINVIPKPAKIQLKEGHFSINAKTKIYYNQNSEEIKFIAEYLAEKINVPTGFQLKPEFFQNQKELLNSIMLKIQQTDSNTSDEGYELAVQNESITLIAGAPIGLFYGVQTLRQLLPSEIESQ